MAAGCGRNSLGRDEWRRCDHPQRPQLRLSAEEDFTTRWETRTVRLSQVTGIDLAIMYWGSP